MMKTKLSAFLSLLLVFFSGAVLGAFAYRLYMVKAVASAPRPDRRPDPEELRKHLIDEMRDAVKLDDQQVAKLNRIYDETRERGDQVRKQLNKEMRGVWDRQVDEIRAILRPDQLPMYEQLRLRHERERKQHRGSGEKR